MSQAREEQPGPTSVELPLRTEGVTTTALAPRTRADTNAGLGTVDGARLASRQVRVGQPRRENSVDFPRLRVARVRRGYAPRLELMPCRRARAPTASGSRRSPEPRGSARRC